MNKTKFGPQTLLYPMPVLLIGSDIEDSPNFMTAAWGGIANGDPPMISVAIRKSRHTLKGITQHMVFSVNIPSADMVKEVDYCGIISGTKSNKVEKCGFNVFYGMLSYAPCINQCPVNLECKVIHILELGSHSLVIGQIMETYISDNCLTAGKPDIDKIRPLLYAPSPASCYQSFGSTVAKAFSIGKTIK